MKDWFDESALLKITDGIGSILNVIILVILVIVTAMIITALFVMPSLIDFVAKRYYPLLQRKNGGSLLGSLVHVISAIIIFIVLLGISLPFLVCWYWNVNVFFSRSLFESAII